MFFLCVDYSHTVKAERAKSLVLLARAQGREGKKPRTVGSGAGQREQKALYCRHGNVMGDLRDLRDLAVVGRPGIVAPKQH